MLLSLVGIIVFGRAFVMSDARELPDYCLKIILELVIRMFDRRSLLSITEPRLEFSAGLEREN